jgi:mannose-1-phosphate guanylyltransferase
VYAVIMAGGGGTRLWPLSRARRPKPFLPLLAEGRTLLGATVERLAPAIEPADVYVVTSARHADAVREVVPAIPPANIIGEPSGRNTAAAVALMAHAIDRADDEVMVVLPADASIRDAAGFRDALGAAAARAAAGDMITLGIEPTGPATGYGYVVATGEPTSYAGRPTWRVARFEEKPTPERAQELIDSGAAYWNAGIFVWQRGTLVEGLARHAPDISAPLAEWATDNPSDGTAGWPGAALAETYEGLRATSIDYALLEPASLQGQVATVPAAIGWSDLGSWSALRDERGDGAPVVTTEGSARVIEVDGGNVLVHAAGERLVAVVGLDDIVVVDTPDALLVSSAAASQDVKKIVDALRADGDDELL